MAFFNTDALRVIRYAISGNGDRHMSNADWLSRALASSNITPSELSRRIAKALPHSNMTPQKVSLMRLGKRKIAFDEIKAICTILGVSPPGASISHKVPVVGVVSAGASASLFGLGQGMFEEVDAPQESTPNTVAVKVQGDSMYGVADDGSYIYYDDVPGLPTDAMIGKLCVVGLADDRVLVKRLKRGSEPGRFTLQSVNAPDIENVEVTWASRVTWVRFPD